MQLLSALGSEFYLKGEIRMSSCVFPVYGRLDE